LISLVLDRPPGTYIGQRIGVVMNLDTNEGILQEVREIAEFEGRDLRQ
jgi:hypothetical protein